jgi:hypothetical protein
MNKSETPVIHALQVKTPNFGGDGRPAFVWKGRSRRSLSAKAPSKSLKHRRSGK